MRCDRWTITKKNKDEVQKTASNRNILCSHSGCIQESSPVKKKKQKCTITTCSLESIDFVIFVFLNKGIRLLVENMSTINTNVELGGILHLKNTVSACFWWEKSKPFNSDLQLPALSWGLCRCSWFQSWCLWFGCNASNTDSHSPAFSIWQSGSCLHSLPLYSNHTALSEDTDKKE